MALENRYLGRLILFALGWAMVGCAPVQPVTNTESEPPPEVTAGSTPTSTEGTPTWINFCEIEPVDGGEITFAVPNNAMVDRNWLNNGVTNDPFLFNQLTDLSIDDATTIVPDVAVSWDVSADGLVYTYHLRPDITWHDGEPLIAADVKWTIELYTHPDSDVEILPLLPLSAIAGIDEFTNGSVDEISGVKVLDDSTVEISLTAPNADFLYAMSGVNLWPKHYFEGMSFQEISNSEKVTSAVIGSGPFKMASYDPETQYMLEANPDYFLGRPHLDRIIFRKDLFGTAAWLAKLESGEIQAGGIAQAEDLPRIEADTQLAVVGDFLPSPTVLWPNHARFMDKRVLQALLYALDRPTIANAVYGAGEALPFVYENIDPTHDWVDAGANAYGYNPEKAKQLLDAAQWDPDHALSLISYSSSEVEKNLIAAMQQYWANVGVSVSVETMGEAEWLQSISDNQNFDLAYGCCGVAMPSDFSAYTCAEGPPMGNDASGYCNEDFDNLVAEAALTVDHAMRQQLWFKITDIFNDELPILPLFQVKSGEVINKKLCDFQYREWTSTVWPERSPETWFLQAGE